jgi:hypothetical protein
MEPLAKPQRRRALNQDICSLTFSGGPISGGMKPMIKKKIFLASSAELIADRKEFENFIARKNKDWVEKGVFLDLVIWEDFLDAMSQTRLQDEYNKAIRECDLFVTLVWTKVGQYTEEEFATAFGQFKATKKPSIFTYFKDVEISVASAIKKDLMSLWAFQEKLSALGHFYAVYKNVDELKLKFEQQLDKLEFYQQPDKLAFKAAKIVVPLQSEDLLTGPLTIGAVLKGPEYRRIEDAYPIGENGVHFVFSLFNPNVLDFLVHEVRVDVLAYAPLNLDHLKHGVGATDVKRCFRASIRQELGSYVATYVSERQGEYVRILARQSECLDVEITANTEGVYDICLRVLGGCAGNRFDVLLNSTKRQIAFFDRSAGYMVDRGLGGRMLKYKDYSLEMESYGLKGY